MRPVRLGDSALDDIDAQVPAERVEDFRRHDLRLCSKHWRKMMPSWRRLGFPTGLVAGSRSPGERLPAFTCSLSRIMLILDPVLWLCSQSMFGSVISGLRHPWRRRPDIADVPHTGRWAVMQGAIPKA